MGRLALIAAMMVAGCTLVDRQTFAPEPVAPGAAERATLPPGEAGAALIVVRFATASPDFARTIRDAVTAAEARRPGLHYEVVLVTPSVTPAALQTGTGDALAVAQAIAASGVTAPRIRLSGRVDRRLAGREIRVFAGG